MSNDRSVSQTPSGASGTTFLPEEGKEGKYKGHVWVAGPEGPGVVILLWEEDVTE